jgi:uncharacterized protein (DUF433 family)
MRSPLQKQYHYVLAHEGGLRLCSPRNLAPEGETAYDGFNSPYFQVETMVDELLSRITINPKVMLGKPVIKGTHLSVEYILNLLAHGATITEIIQEYEGLVEADIQACFLFAKGLFLH